MKDNLLDQNFDNLIKAAGTQAILEMEEECANEEIPKIQFSKEHEEKMRQFFANYRAQYEAESKVKEEAKEKEREKDIRHIKIRKMVALVAATMTVLVLGITTVGAWKGSLVGTYLKDNGEYSDFIVGKPEKGLILKNVYFGYIPDEYEYTETKDTKQRLFFLFNHKTEDKYFYFIIEPDMYNGKMNTESGDVGEEFINDKDMIYSERDDLNIITWFENNTQNTLCTNDSKKELIKIAEKIEFLK